MKETVSVYNVSCECLPVYWWDHHYSSLYDTHELIFSSSIIVKFLVRSWRHTDYTHTYKALCQYNTCDTTNLFILILTSQSQPDVFYWDINLIKF